MGPKCCNQCEDKFTQKLTTDDRQMSKPNEEIKKVVGKDIHKGFSEKIKFFKYGQEKNTFKSITHDLINSENSIASLKKVIKNKEQNKQSPNNSHSELWEGGLATPSQNKTIKPAVDISKKKSIVVDLSRFKNERRSSVKDRYDVFETIGKGAFGEVRIIKQKETGVVRTLKSICKNIHIPSENYLNEIEIIKQLEHPNVLRLYEFSQDSEYLYFITEYCEGGDLLSVISSLRKIKEGDVAKIMKQILSAVHYCHSKNIMHRDIKPENILFSNKRLESNIKVINFGRSLILKDTMKPHELTGSLYYIAPEILAGREYDLSCDIWSCGVLMFLMLSGTPPFIEKSKEETMKAIQTGKFTFSSSLWSRVSSEAKDIISKMLQKNPLERITAENTLNHPWIKKYSNRKKEEKDELLILSLRNLRKFQAQNTFQKVVLSYISSQEIDSEEKEEVREIFSMIDTDNNGYISEDELVSGYERIYRNKARAMKDAQQVMKLTDINKNGVIDYNEFLMANLGYKNILAEEKLKQVFDFYDESKNGVITLDEMRRIFGSFCSEDQILTLMAEADSNGDNEINFEEFKDMMSGLKTVKHSLKPMSFLLSISPIHQSVPPLQYSSG